MPDTVSFVNFMSVGIAPQFKNGKKGQLGALEFKYRYFYENVSEIKH